MMIIEKKRVKAEAVLCFGNDGRDAHWIIKYSCPTCGREIICGYKSKTACDECGTFYDWGDKKPRIVTTHSVEWD